MMEVINSFKVIKNIDKNCINYISKYANVVNNKDINTRLKIIKKNYQ